MPHLNLKVIEADLYAAPNSYASVTTTTSFLDLVLVRCERQDVQFYLQVYTTQGCGLVWCGHHKLIPQGQGKSAVRDGIEVTLIPLVLAGAELSLFVDAAVLIPKYVRFGVTEHMLMLRHESPIVPYSVANELVAKFLGGYKPEALICWPNDDVDKLVGALDIDVKIHDIESTQPTPEELAETERKRAAFRSRLETVIAKRGGPR